MKRIHLAFLIVPLLILSGCSIQSTPLSTQSSVSVSSSEISSTETSSLTQSSIAATPNPPQPIHFENLDEAIAFIHSPNLEKYWDDFQTVYMQMIDRFKSDGYIIRAVGKDPSVETIFHFFLYPKVKYEDSGIAYWFQYKGKDYQVIVYHADTSLISSEPETLPSMSDYYKVRMGSPNIPPEYSIELNGRPAYAVFEHHNPDHRKMVAQFIDSEHYVRVRAGTAEITKEELLEFIQVLEFEYVPLN